MTQPPSIDDRIERDQGDGDDWAEWEQTFREARPVLPQAAMDRIQAAMQAELEERTRGNSRRRPPRRWLMAIGWVVVAGAIFGGWHYFGGSSGRPFSGPKMTVHDRFPVEWSGNRATAPERPILPASQIAAAFPDAATTQPATPVLPPGDALGTFLARAKLLVASKPTAAHRLGLLELQRVTGGAFDPAFPTALDEPAYLQLRCWYVLGEADSDAHALQDATRALRAADPGNDWLAVFDLCAAMRLQRPLTSVVPLVPSAPLAFPPRAARDAAVDLLVEVGMSRTEAGLNVLTHRQYEPLNVLRQLDAELTRQAEGLRSPDTAAATRLLAVRDRFRAGYLSAARDLVEHLSALKQADQSAEARRLVARTSSLKYLTEPQDLAVLLARLGPQQAWDRLVHPLLDNERKYVVAPSDFSGPAAVVPHELLVDAAGKRSDEGVTTYETVSLHLGTVQVTCDKLSMFRSTAGLGVLFTGSRKVRVTGLRNGVTATASEFSFDTSASVVRLSGTVQVTDSDGISRNLKSCEISPTGDVSEISR